MGYMPHLLPLATFKDPSNGYIVDNSCAFGVEIFVISPSLGNWESLSFVDGRNIISNIADFTWEIRNFSKLNETSNHQSQVFTVRGIRWHRYYIIPPVCHLISPFFSYK